MSAAWIILAIVILLVAFAGGRSSGHTRLTGDPSVPLPPSDGAGLPGEPDVPWGDDECDVPCSDAAGTCDHRCPHLKEPS